MGAAEESAGGGQLGAGCGRILADVGPRAAVESGPYSWGNLVCLSFLVYKREQYKETEAQGCLKEGSGLLASSVIVGLGTLTPGFWLPPLSHQDKELSSSPSI